MEEEKAAALYEELQLKGGGAARFKHGLGFQSVRACAKWDHILSYGTDTKIFGQVALVPFDACYENAREGKWLTEWP
jgi:hypothetical protein